MFLIKLEMLLNSFRQAQNLFFGEGQSHDLHSHWKSSGPTQAFPHCGGDIIVPNTLVLLFIWSHSGDGSDRRGHSQQVPNDSVSAENVAVVGDAVIRCLCAEGRTDHEVQVLVSPKGDPFLSQLFDPAHHALVFVKTQFS